MGNVKTAVKKISRRHFVLAAGSLAAAGGLGLSRIGYAAEGRITVADPGGAWGAAARKAFYDPFEKASGIRVASVAREADPLAQIKAQIQTKSYLWDVTIATPYARILLDKLDLIEPAGLAPASFDGMIPGSITDSWVGVDVYAAILAYNTKTFGDKGPQSWADFWNVEAFPGRRSLRKSPVDTLEAALLADGVSPKDLYPLDLDRAFKSLDKIKPHITAWWGGGAQSTQMLQSGEVDMILLWNGRAQAAVDGGAPVKVVWNQGLYGIEGFFILKGSPRAELARRFLEFCTDPLRQAQYVQEVSYGPTNLHAFKSVSAERAAILPTSEKNFAKLIASGDDYWAEQIGPVTQRFNSWLLK
ncbi:ABC transporter substrate-binding protein [Pollutimonas bauzanensis]|uniref:Putative spermidine/putrescine transport system substrate-binding protein n=1 Tax=Pollutimonas bauzanensis TaxID=658167 RepID=A0A1M5VJ96_9BURK|nr:ABC transporter substrate-binding protein [Pollutimonas bauzanensis]SHH75329.1 putative spermidine/putrescine transport system substrate-binding protein [Pollutimonas bauzanensis]